MWLMYTECKYISHRLLWLSVWLPDKWWLPGLSVVGTVLAKRTVCAKEAALGRAC